MFAIYSHVMENLGDRCGIDLRLTGLSDQLVTELDFNTRRILAPQLVILSGKDEQGKGLVASQVKADLAARYSLNHSHCPELMVVELGGVYAEYEDSLRQVAKQLLKRLLHTRTTPKRQKRVLPSREGCEQLLEGLLQREGGLLLILDDLEHFVQQGKTGLLFRLLKLPTNANLQVKILGLTRQPQLQSLLIQNGFISLYPTRVISSSEVCNRDVVVGGTSAAHLLAEMLQVSEDIQEAGTWNAAVQREVRSLTGANMPKCVTRAAFVGELTCLHLMQIGWTAVEAAARRQDFMQQADIIDAMAQKFGQPCQVIDNPTRNCSELQAAMLAAAFCHRVLYEDKVPLTFETIYLAFQPLRLAMNENFRFTKVQAWAAVQQLLGWRFLICAEKGQQEAVLHPPDHRTLTIMIDLSQAKAVMCAANTSAKLIKRMTKICLIPNTV